MKYYDLSTLSFLLADPNSHTCHLVRQILRTFQVRNVMVAASQDEVVATLRNSPVDILISAWRLPPDGGSNLARRIRAGKFSDVNPYLPIVLLTSHTEKENIIDARDAGMTEILAKPVSPLSLYRHIVKVIEDPRSFVSAETFKGPDRRRRRNDPEGAGIGRRGADQNKSAA